MIKTAQLQPDIVTYGVLSLGCQTAEQAHELLQEMCDKGIRLILHITLHVDFLQHSFVFVLQDQYTNLRCNATNRLCSQKF